MDKYTAIVVGTGPAGVACAVRLSQLGARVAAVERDYVGGICTNWGCTPSKAMIESAKINRIVRESAHYGVHTGDVRVNFAEVAARRDEVVLQARLTQMELLQHHGVQIVRGEAELTAPGQVTVRGGKLDRDGLVMHFSGHEEHLEAEHVILATGSVPMMPDFVQPNDPFVVSSNRLITVGELPRRLTIVGGGVIGLEFATIFSNLGSQVTIVEYLDRVLATLDPAISAAITREMEAVGVRVLPGHRVFSMANGVVYAENRTTHETLEVPSDAVLVAIGRQAVIRREMFDRAGIAYDKRGICVDDYLRTNVPGVWAVGDATGKSILAHVGIQQGIVAAENIAGGHDGALRPMDYSVIPAVVYSIPEVAAVGQVPENLDGVSVHTVPFSANLRARIEGYQNGFIKIWVRDERVLAAQAMGYYVSEIIQELANMIALRTPLRDVAHIIHAHPTYSEITRSVLELALGQPVDFVPTE